MITKLQDSSVKQIAAGAEAVEFTPQVIISGGIAAYKSGGLSGLFNYAKIIYKLLTA